jgi:hypothetical protein
LERLVIKMMSNAVEHNNVIFGEAFLDGCGVEWFNGALGKVA